MLVLTELLGGWIFSVLEGGFEGVVGEAPELGWVEGVDTRGLGGGRFLVLGDWNREEGNGLFSANAKEILAV